MSSYFLVLTLFVSACTTSPETDPAYVSPSHYANYNCKQISAEMQRLSSKLEQAEQENTTGQVLETALAAYAISNTCPVVFSCSACSSLLDRRCISALICLQL